MCLTKCCPARIRTQTNRTRICGATITQQDKILYKSEKRGSNPRPRPWEGRALPTELLSLLDCKYTKFGMIIHFLHEF